MKGDPTKALNQFKEYIESYLDLNVSIDLRSHPEEIAKKELLCDKLFSRIEKTPGTYGYYQKINGVRENQRGQSS